MSDQNDTFNTTEMTEALDATSDTDIKPKGIQPVGPPADKEEAAAKARAYGFVTPIKYDYSVYGVKTGPDAEDEAESVPAYNWAASAEKYEWDEEFGEVGPRVPELEDLLFKGEHMMKIGIHMQNLTFRVTVEGPVRPGPIFKVHAITGPPLISFELGLNLHSLPTYLSIQS